LIYALIGDSNITAHTTSKISTLSKTLLNTAIVYNDQNNYWGTFYQDIGQIAQPTAPLSGRRRLYVDSSTSQLSIVRADGSRVSLEASAWDPNLAETITNKTMDAASNTFKGIQLMSTVKKVGSYYATTGTGGTGILNGFLISQNGTLTFNRNTTDGIYQTFTTGSSNTNTAAVKTNDTYTCRAFNPTFKCKFRLPSVSSVRMDLGFISDMTFDPKNSDWLANESGAALSFGTGRGNQTSFYLSTNNGSAASNFSGPIATATANTVYSIEIVFDNAASKVKYSWNGGAFVDVTTQVPAATILLGVAFGVQTTTGSTKSIDIFGVDVASDK
jgi:hypothetical protein